MSASWSMKWDSELGLGPVRRAEGEQAHRWLAASDELAAADRDMRQSATLGCVVASEP
jgi:hypothetical protein